MQQIDLIALFIGRAVLVAGALGLSVSVVVAAYGAVWLLFQMWSKRVFRAAINWDAVRAWHVNGRPQWKIGEDGIYRFVPTLGPADENEPA